MRKLNLLLLIMILVGCKSVNRHSTSSVEQLRSPAGPDSGQVYLYSAGDRLWMSWLEGTKDRAFKLAEWESRKWSESRTIISGAPFFVNWADFPSIAAFDKNHLIAHWLQQRGTGTYAYDVMISRSTNGGKTWTQGMPPHSDRSENEHGFVSMLPMDHTRFVAAWLDGRKFKKDVDSHHPSNEMALMVANFERDQFSEKILDGRVCDCCQTDAAWIKNGAIIVYRDRSMDEVRDHSYVLLQNGKWTEPKSLHVDGWKINACPVNGPAVTADGNHVAVAWFTGAGGKPQVQAKFSNDGANSFGKAIRIDAGNPSGRIDIVMLQDGSAVVSWLENTEKGAEIRVRRIKQEGSADPHLVIADSTSARSSGNPRMARLGAEIFVGWTYAAKPSQVRIAKVSLR